MASKNQIAQRRYGEQFEDLTPGQKAAVTREHANQGTGSVGGSTTSGTGIRCEIGRIGVNGTKACLLKEGVTVQDLLTQSGYAFDEKKEGVLMQSSGEGVNLTDTAINGEVYVISPDIKSA